MPNLSSLKQVSGFPPLLMHLKTDIMIQNCVRTDNVKIKVSFPVYRILTSRLNDDVCSAQVNR